MCPVEMIDYALFVLAGIYVSRVVFFVVGVRREASRLSTAPYQPSITVVVPSRNEEENIERCVRSLIAMDYPKGKLTIVCVNDRSTDSTGSILDTLALQHSELRVIHVAEDEVDPNLRGKPGALQRGIDESDSELILMTDADCEVPVTWASTVAQQFHDQRVGLVGALTSVSGTSFWDRVQDVEWTYTQTMAVGGVGNGVPLGCFGNNLAVRRSVFNELGGYRDIEFSVTEDLALQDAVFKAGYRIRQVISPLTSVVTLPCRSLGEYVKQRHRWVRGGVGLGGRAALFVASSFALWGGAILAVMFQQLGWIIVLVVLRFVADSTLIGWSSIRLRRYSTLPFIVPAMMLLISTELVLPILAMRKRVVWKQQTFQG